MSKLYIDLEKDIENLSTITDFIRFTASYLNHSGVFFGHGTDNAYDESVNLVLSSLGLANDLDPHVWSAKLTQSEKQLMLENINRRVNDRTPVPYIVKEAWFANMSFYVDERVIIPRSPIAELIDDDFSPWVEPEKVTNVLDMCTGSGCIAVAAAMAFEDAEVDAVDISDDAIEIATQNVENYGLEDRVNVIKSDLFNELQGAKYDLIIANPPYVAEDEYNDLSKEYFHEPKNALLANEQGLEIAKRILNQARDFLKEEGVLVLEVGSAQYALEEMYPDAPFTWLHFERGGDGVLLITAKELEEYKDMFAQKVS